MTRLDRHIRIARNKLTLGEFAELAAMTLLAAAAAIWAAIVVQRLLGRQMPGSGRWLIGAVAGAIGVAGVLALRRRPTAHQAAVAIDRRLELKEKFSTALFARGSSDPFAKAAVADAEKAAESVALARQFPIRYPRWGNALVIAAIATLCTACWMPTFDMLGIQANHQKKVAEAVQQRNTALANARQALMQLDSAPAGIADADAVRLARQDLEHLLAHPPADATPIQEHVESAMQKLAEAQQHMLASTALAQNQPDPLEAGLAPPAADKGLVADAHRELSQGKIDAAMDSLTQAVNDFPAMSPAEQQTAAQQMSNLANQIQQQANNPQTQKDTQQQLQKMGASQQQSQQMTQLMQQAAQGSPQAGQQLNQMTIQLIQQANAGASASNNKNGPSQQQQRQTAQSIQHNIGQMQQQANAQARAQQLSQSAQQLAKAMQQSAGQSQTPGGKKPVNSAGNPGGRPGGNQQQMVAAGQQMQNALGELKSTGAGPEANAASAGQPQNQNGGSNQPLAQDPQDFSGGWGTGHEGLHVRTAPDPGQHNVTPQVSPSDMNPDGHLLASSLVNDDAPIKGNSKQTLAKVAAAAEQDTTDEVDEDRIPRSAQNAVREYFQTLKQDGENANGE